MSRLMLTLGLTTALLIAGAFVSVPSGTWLSGKPVVAECCARA